jgi:hypothetical protein
MNCDLAQGFYLSRALPDEVFRRWFDRYQRAREQEQQAQSPWRENAGEGSPATRLDLSR